MPLRDLLKKKEKVEEKSASSSVIVPPPDFKFVRTTTTTEEVLSVPADETPEPSPSSKDKQPSKPERKYRLSFQRSPRAASPSTETKPNTNTTSTTPPKDSSSSSSRLDRFHIRAHSRSTSASSSHVPENLPAIQSSGAQGEASEAEWEKRATLLAQKNGTSAAASTENLHEKSGDGAGAAASGHKRTISNPDTDVNIQEAIRLHEAGELEQSTAMFGRLADPGGDNNALAQVLYGLALRHGWGCEADPGRAITYLTQAASNSAAVEAMALESGLEKGGAAKGELVLAIYELGNSFRHGWGVKKDPVAARHYYETAANLGDTDAMGEIAWCYLEGFGGKKDKFVAAQYLRMAESKGVKSPGDSWIWKEKYSPGSKSK